MRATAQARVGLHVIIDNKAAGKPVSDVIYKRSSEKTVVFRVPA